MNPQAVPGRMDQEVAPGSRTVASCGDRRNGDDLRLGDAGDALSQPCLELQPAGRLG
jgi:hypothetical protein